MNHLSLLQTIESYENISEYLDLGMFALALAVSLVAAILCAMLYRAFYESRGTGSQIYKAFAPLSLAITTLFLCIQVSIPLSLGLLGSLSIIRFRTPIKEPEEVGSIMLVIASSIAAATFHFAFIFVMLAFAAVSSFAAAKFRGAKFLKRDGLLTLALPDPETSPLPALEPVFAAQFTRFKVQSCSSHSGTTTLQLSFSGLRNDVCALQEAVRKALPAVQTVNVFLDRPGGFR